MTARLGPSCPAPSQGLKEVQGALPVSSPSSHTKHQRAAAFPPSAQQGRAPLYHCPGEGPGACAAQGGNPPVCTDHAKTQGVLRTQTHTTRASTPHASNTCDCHHPHRPGAGCSPPSLGPAASRRRDTPCRCRHSWLGLGPWVRFPLEGRKTRHYWKRKAVILIRPEPGGLR